MTRLADLTCKTLETVSMAIEDGPILNPFSWDRNPNVRRQIVGAVASRQTNDGVLRKWHVDLRYRKLKKDGSFAAVGAGSIGAWNREELARPWVAECLRLVCDRVAIAADELYDYGDILQEVRDEVAKDS